MCPGDPNVREENCSRDPHSPDVLFSEEALILETTALPGETPIREKIFPGEQNIFPSGTQETIFPGEALVQENIIFPGETLVQDATIFPGEVPSQDQEISVSHPSHVSASVQHKVVILFFNRYNVHIWGRAENF